MRTIPTAALILAALTGSAMAARRGMDGHRNPAPALRRPDMGSAGLPRT